MVFVTYCVQHDVLNGLPSLDAKYGIGTVLQKAFQLIF